MGKVTASWMSTKKARQNLRRRMVSGLLVLVPLGMTIFVGKFLYRTTATIFTPVCRGFFTEIPDWAVGSVSVLLLLAMLYLVGLMASHVVGRQIIGLGEAVLRHIPIVKSLYAASSRLVAAVSAGEGRPSPLSVVLIDYPFSGMRTLGVVIGTLVIKGSGVHNKVIIPGTPLPLGCFFLIVPRDQCIPTDVSVEAIMEVTVSGGILSPKRITPSPENAHGTLILTPDS